MRNELRRGAAILALGLGILGICLGAGTQSEDAASAGSVYRDPQGRFQAPAPSGWKIAGSADVATCSLGAAVVSISVVEQAPSGDAAVSRIAEGFGRQWRDFRRLWNGRSTLGGAPSAFAVYEGTNQQGRPSELRVVCTDGPGTAFALVMTAPQSDWGPAQAGMRQIEEGFSGTSRFSANRCSSSTILESPSLQPLRLGSENPEKRL